MKYTRSSFWLFLRKLPSKLELILSAHFILCGGMKSNAVTPQLDAAKSPDAEEKQSYV